MSIDREELVNLDATIAAFIIPRLEAFKDATQSYPADLDSLADWHAELDVMIDSFRLVAAVSRGEYTAHWPMQDSRPGLHLFADRLEHLWL